MKTEESERRNTELSGNSKESKLIKNKGPMGEFDNFRTGSYK